MLERIATFATIVLVLTSIGQTALADESNGSGDLDLAALMNLDSQVTSATKIAQSISEAPAIIAVITRKDLADRGYDSVAEALGALPGFFVNSDYILPDVGIRGISGELRGGSRLIKVMLNGHPVSFRSETTNWLNGALVPIDAIDRIEVIRGPGSALYGANAFLGVVNIITRKATTVDGVSFRYQGHRFGDKLGQSLSAVSAFHYGPLDVVVGYQQQSIDRSGLRVRCGTTFASDDFSNSNSTPCEEQDDLARGIEFDLDPASPTFEQSVLSSTDDWDRNSAFLAQATLDLGVAFGADQDAFGTVNFMANLQRLDTGASFADWGVLSYERYEDDNSIVSNSGNRVALFNDLYAVKWSKGFWDDSFVVTAGGRLAHGGPSSHEALRETKKVERQRSGFEGHDLFVELFGVPVEGVGKVDWLTEGSVVDSWTLMASADMSQDYIDLVDDAGGDGTYRRVRPISRGVLGQSTLSMLNKRVNLVAGLRYDDYRGANLSEDTVRGMETEDADRLCDSDLGRRVCYSKASARYGLTTVVAKDLFEFEDSKFAVDELYLKFLYGTAFKAPSSLFLYHEGILGNVPVNPNPGLQPQDLRSLEVLLGGRLFDGFIDFSGTFFVNVLENKAVFTKDGVGIIGANASKIETVGVEVEAKASWRWGHLYLSLGQQDSNVIDEDQDSSSEIIPDTFAFPETVVVGGLNLTADDWFTRANVEVRYIGERVGYYLTRGASNSIDNRYVLPSYTTVDLVLGTTDFEFIRFKPSRISFVVKNLLDAEFNYPGFQPYYRVDVPGEPRRFVLTFEQTL